MQHNTIPIEENRLGEIYENSLSMYVRKHGGIFYTPKIITEYICNETIGKLCEEKKLSLNFNPNNLNTLKEYKKWLLKIKIIDPSCGCGAFLLQTFDFLINEYKIIDQYISNFSCTYLQKNEIEKHIITKNLYGVDIDEDSIEITKLSLALKLKDNKNIFSILSKNIKCGNSLISSKEIDVEKAFDWNKEFQQIMNSGGFDVVIGNPPYITFHGRRNVKLPNQTIEYFKKNYECVLPDTGKYNAAMFFIERAITLTNSNGKIGYITDISFFENFYAGTKKLLLEKTHIDIIVKGLSLFRQVASGQVIIVASKQKNNHFAEWYNEGLQSKQYTVNQTLWYNKANNYQFFLPTETQIEKLIQKIRVQSKLLIELFPKKLIRTGESVGKKESEFISKSMPLLADVPVYEYLEGSKSLPNKYAKLKPTQYFRYDLNLLKIKNQQFKNQSIEKSTRLPKVLGLGDQKAFDNPKIIIRQSAENICATYTTEKYIYNRSYYSINNQNSSGVSGFDLLYTLSILNSSTTNFYAKNTGLIKIEKGKQPQIRLSDLKNIPIKNISFSKQKKFIEKTKLILHLNRTISEKKENFYDTIEKNFSIKINQRKYLQNEVIDFKNFIKILKKRNISLKIKEENEWKIRFESFKNEIQSIQNQINDTENEINHMVYKLYKLTEQEIEIVENTLKFQKN